LDCEGLSVLDACIAQMDRESPPVTACASSRAVWVYCGGAKLSRTRCSRVIKLASSADERDANTARNRAKVSSNAFLMTASPLEVNR
jgi:hypothetical protein